MTDQGFLISDYLENIGASLNISAFLNGREQIRKTEVKESQSVGSVRIYQVSNITRWLSYKKVSSDKE